MKVCRLITGKIIETQFKDNADTLLSNAKISHPGQESEVIEMTIDEYEKAIKEQNFKDLTYSQKRALEYPPVTDYLDGIVKNDQAQIQKYINDCLAIKVKYPKI